MCVTCHVSVCECVVSVVWAQPPGKAPTLFWVQPLHSILQDTGMPRCKPCIETSFLLPSNKLSSFLVNQTELFCRNNFALFKMTTNFPDCTVTVAMQNNECAFSTSGIQVKCSEGILEPPYDSTQYLIRPWRWQRVMY